MKQIATFTRDYVNALFAGRVGKPGPGDCWYRGLHTVEDNKPLGEAINSPSHLRRARQGEILRSLAALERDQGLSSVKGSQMDIGRPLGLL